jgi:hypothetical protein
MKVTIIVDDNAVYVEGNALEVDCSALLKTEVSVVQWYGSFGEIEYATNHETGARRPNARITDFSPFQSLLDAWEEVAKADDGGDGAS